MTLIQNKQKGLMDIQFFLHLRH